MENMNASPTNNSKSIQISANAAPEKFTAKIKNALSKFGNFITKITTKTKELARETCTQIKEDWNSLSTEEKKTIILGIIAGTLFLSLVICGSLGVTTAALGIGLTLVVFILGANIYQAIKGY